jgi:signal transduction histidine kinase
VLNVASRQSVEDRERVPLRLWIAPLARVAFGAWLAKVFGHRAELVNVPDPHRELVGPAILVLSIDDLGGPEREALLLVANAALPGRPLVVGEGRNRESLLDVINTWRAFRFLPLTVPEEALVAVVGKAHEAYALEAAVEQCAVMLRDDCRQLDAAVDELRSTQDQLLHAERLATVGRVVGTLLFRTKARLGNLEVFRAARDRLAGDDPLAEDLDSVIEAADAFSSLLEDMLALSEHRRPKMVLRRERLDSLVERSVRLFRCDPLARARDISLDCGSGATTEVDRRRMLHVLLTLLRDAAETTATGRQIDVRTYADAQFAVVEVTDGRSGESLDTCARTATPFFGATGEDGVGLGLRLCQTSLEAQGGTLEFVGMPGQGARFRVRLPLAAHDPIPV